MPVNANKNTTPAAIAIEIRTTTPTAKKSAKIVKGLEDANMKEIELTVLSEAEGGKGMEN